MTTKNEQITATGPVDKCILAADLAAVAIMLCRLDAKQKDPSNYFSDARELLIAAEDYLAIDGDKIAFEGYWEKTVNEGAVSRARLLSLLPPLEKYGEAIPLSLLIEKRTSNSMQDKDRAFFGTLTKRALHETIRKHLKMHFHKILRKEAISASQLRELEECRQQALKTRNQHKNKPHQAKNP